MVDHRVLAGVAAKAGFVASKENSLKFFKNFWQTLSKDEKARMEKVFKEKKTTFDKFSAMQAASPEFQKKIAIEQWIKKSVIPSLKVTDEDAKKEYEANIKYFKTPGTAEGQVAASHILIRPEEGAKDKAKAEADAKKKAENILKDIKAGKVTFDDAASKFSMCPSKSNKGSLGSFGKKQMVPEFEKTAFGLKEGEMSPELTKTQFGYHIIRRDKGAKSTTIPFEKVKEGLKQSVQKKKFKEFIENTLKAEKKKLNAKIFIKMPQPKFNPNMAQPPK